MIWSDTTQKDLMNTYKAGLAYVIGHIYLSNIAEKLSSTFFELKNIVSPINKLSVQTNKPTDHDGVFRVTHFSLTKKQLKYLSLEL